MICRHLLIPNPIGSLPCPSLCIFLSDSLLLSAPISFSISNAFRTGISITEDIYISVYLSNLAAPTDETSHCHLYLVSYLIFLFTCRASFWRYTDNSFETLLPTLEGLNYEAQAIQQVRDILEHIQEHPLGVEGVSLRRSFPLGEFLLEALQQLEAHDLIKRVGVASYMYVHKAHMRNWVVHTFHIKRLERERVQNWVSASPATLPGVMGQKRKMVDQSLDLQASCSKKARLDEEPQQSSGEDTDSEEALLQCARRSKRMKKSETKAKTEMKSDSEATRDVIAMRPHPWIRVNASLNRRVLDRWMGALLSECITRNGCTVHSLFLRFPHLLPVDTMLLLELLCDLGCLRLVELDPPTVHLESSYDDDLQERPATILYDPKYTYVKVQTDAIGQLTNFIGIKKYTSEFI